MNPLLLTAWLACQSLDLTTTAIALRNPNLTEGNTLLRGRQGIALKISVNLGAYLWSRKQDSKGVRYVVPATFAVAGCVPGVMNLRTMRSVR